MTLHGLFRPSATPLPPPPPPRHLILAKRGAAVTRVTVSLRRRE